MADIVILTREGDWAQILALLSESAKDEVRAAVGNLIGESEMRKRS